MHAGALTHRSRAQAQKSWLRPSQIDKIFVTHLHGDHSFGIAGLMCLIGQDREKRKEPLELYGPRGLRALLRVTLQLTGSRSIPPYRVIELHGIPFLHGRWQREPRTECDLLEPPRDWRFKEVDDGQDVWPDENGVWHLVEGERLSVRAAPMQHTMPCVGYVVQEAKGADRLLIERVEEIVEANKEALRSKYGRAYKKVYQDIKALRPGEVFSLPSGETIAAEEVLVPAREGRKVVFLGDTCDAYGIAPHARGADVVVHEATNAWIPGLDDKTPQEVEYDTISHGHSTPQMAGEFARDVGAKKLILTHFSPRCTRARARARGACCCALESDRPGGAPDCRALTRAVWRQVPRGHKQLHAALHEHNGALRARGVGCARLQGHGGVRPHDRPARAPGLPRGAARGRQRP
jgi:ribonuclease Z